MIKVIAVTICTLHVLQVTLLELGLPNPSFSTLDVEFYCQIR